MANAELIRILDEQDLAKTQSQALLDAFGAPFEAAGEILATYQDVRVTDEADSATMKQARAMRLALKQTRVDVEHRRKDLKADIVKQGKAIDSVARFVRDVIEPAETYLETQEKYAEIRAAERAAALLASRQHALTPYVSDLSVFNLVALSDEQFTELLENSKAVREAEQERQRIAAEQAAAERLERERENERIRQENAELQRQAAEERQKRETIEAEQRRAADAERERIAAEQEKARRESESPDRDKILRFVDALAIIRTQKLPDVTTSGGREIVLRIEKRLSQLGVEAKRDAEGLDGAV